MSEFSAHEALRGVEAVEEVFDLAVAEAVEGDELTLTPRPVPPVLLASSRRSSKSAGQRGSYSVITTDSDLLISGLWRLASRRGFHP